MPGIPVGPGTVLYLLAALCMPIVGACRRVAGRTSPRSARPVSHQVGVAVAMVVASVVVLWAFDRAGRLVNPHARASGLVLLSSPLLIAVTLLSAAVAFTRVRRFAVGRRRSRASDDEVNAA